jgi:hypothetical protein
MTTKPREKTDVEPVVEKPAPRPAGQCVVDDGTPHVGRAVNGLVCSRHAMLYDSQGRKRGS